MKKILTSLSFAALAGLLASTALFASGCSADTSESAQLTQAIAGNSGFLAQREMDAFYLEQSPNVHHFAGVTYLAEGQAPLNGSFEASYSDCKDRPSDSGWLRADCGSAFASKGFYLLHTAYYYQNGSYAPSATPKETDYTVESVTLSYDPATRAVSYDLALRYQWICRGMGCQSAPVIVASLYVNLATSNPTATVLQASAAVGSNGVINQGAQQILSQAGQTLCWSNVPMSGVTSIAATLGNGENAGDSIAVLFNDAPIGTLAVPHTANAWTADTTVTAPVSSASGTGKLCLKGAGSNWIASIGKVALNGSSEPTPVCVPQCSGKSCGDDGCGGSCGACGAGSSCSEAGQCVAVAPTCSDGIANQGETGVDCGGPCAACPTGVTLTAASATGSAGVISEGTQKILTQSGQRLCWSNVNVTGMSVATVTVGNGEPAGDQLKVTIDGAVLGTVTVPHTNNAWTADTTVTSALTAQSRTGTLCLEASGANWIASVRDLVLASK